MADQLFHDMRRRLREAYHLAPEARQTLADAADRLADALASEDTPPEEAARLREAASGVIKAVNERHDAGLLQAAQERLEQAVVAAEAQAPVAVGLARQLIDALATIGI